MTTATGTTYTAVDGHTYTKSAYSYTNSHHSNECPCTYARELIALQNAHSTLGDYINNHHNRMTRIEDSLNRLRAKHNEQTNPKFKTALAQLVKDRETELADEVASTQSAKKEQKALTAELEEWAENLKQDEDFEALVDHGFALIYNA